MEPTDDRHVRIVVWHNDPVVWLPRVARLLPQSIQRKHWMGYGQVLATTYPPTKSYGRKQAATFYLSPSDPTDGFSVPGERVEAIRGWSFGDGLTHTTGKLLAYASDRVTYPAHLFTYAAMALDLDFIAETPQQAEAIGDSAPGMRAGCLPDAFWLRYG